MPSSGASISMLTLSVVHSAIGSPFSTGSPSCLSQATMVDSSWVKPNFGMMISLAMARSLVFALDELASLGDDVLYLRHGVVFQRAVVGDGDVEARQPADRRVEVVERLTRGDARHDLAAVTAPPNRLMHAQRLAGLLDRVEDGRVVKRVERAGVYHLDLNALLGEDVRRLKRALHHQRGCHDGQVGALAGDVRLAERDAVHLLRHVGLRLVEQLVLNEDHGIVVVDG